MKKIGFMLLMIVVILILIILLFFGTSGKRTDVFLQDYQVSEDGKRMKIKVSVSSSMGYIRDLKVKQDGERIQPHCFDRKQIGNRLSICRNIWGCG